MPRIRLYATLRVLAGQSEFHLPAAEAEPVGKLLQRLVSLCPSLKGEVLSEGEQELLPYVQVFIGGRSIRDLQGLATPVPPDGEVAIFPPVAGG